jgi:hypothetical protein
MSLFDVIGVAMTAALAVAAWSVLRRPSGVVVGDKGILDPHLRVGWIRWDEIEGAYQPSKGNTERLCLRLRVTERLARRLRRIPAAARARSTPESVEVSLDLAGSDLSVVEILQQILAHAGGRDRSVPVQ